MGFYILKTWTVIGGSFRAEFRTYEGAAYYNNWLYGDQAIEDTQIVETFCECVMLAGVVYIPDSII